MLAELTFTFELSLISERRDGEAAKCTRVIRSLSMISHL